MLLFQNCSSLMDAMAHPESTKLTWPFVTSTRLRR